MFFNLIGRCHRLHADHRLDYFWRWIGMGKAFDLELSMLMLDGVFGIPNFGTSTHTVL